MTGVSPRRQVAEERSDYALYPVLRSDSAAASGAAMLMLESISVLFSRASEPAGDFEVSQRHVAPHESIFGRADPL
jgi:hypothetical protein